MQTSNLYQLPNKAFINGHKYAEQQVRADRDGCHPDVLKFSQKMIRLARSYDIPLFAHEFKRGRDRQNKLKAQGFSNSSFGNSPHNYGLAVDIIHGTRAWKLSEKEWDILGAIGHECARSLSLKVEWGGYWSNPWDPAHWELANWRDLKDWETDFKICS